MEWQPDPEGWRRSYQDSGYLVVENAVDPDLLEQSASALERIVAGRCRAIPCHHISVDLSRWRATASTATPAGSIATPSRISWKYRYLIRSFVT